MLLGDPQRDVGHAGDDAGVGRAAHAAASAPASRRRPALPGMLVFERFVASEHRERAGKRSLFTDTVGYASVDGFRRAFTRRLGASLVEYRKRFAN